MHVSFQQTWPWSWYPAVCSARIDRCWVNRACMQIWQVCIQTANASPLLASLRASLTSADDPPGNHRQTHHHTNPPLLSWTLFSFTDIHSSWPHFGVVVLQHRLLYHSSAATRTRSDKPTDPFFVFHHYDVNLFGDWQILFDTKHIIQSQSLPLFLFFLWSSYCCYPRFTHVASDDGFQNQWETGWMNRNEAALSNLLFSFYFSSFCYCSETHSIRTIDISPGILKYRSINCSKLPSTFFRILILLASRTLLYSTLLDTD
jgi:hypothetical protein